MSFSSPSLSWLLETDDAGVRYLALRDLVDLLPGNSELLKAKKEAYAYGPIGEVLKHMNQEGYWNKSGSGYNPKYTSAVWSLILLSQLGVSTSDDSRIGRACEYYLNHAFYQRSLVVYKRSTVRNR